MNSNVPTKSARLTCATRRSYRSMNHIQLLASFATAQCRRFIAFLVFNLRETVSTQPIIRATRSLQGFRYIGSDLRFYAKLYKIQLTHWVHSRLEPIKGSHRAASRRARGVAFVIGISLSMQTTAVGIGSIDPYYDLHSLADYQLTDKQYECHNDIVFRESSFRIDARNGSHHGYYQIRNEKLIDAPYDYQFYFYWKYVQHRYGITKYDEPDYCKALHHLKTKGWQ